MKLEYLLLVLVYSLIFSNPVTAGLFGNSQVSSSGGSAQPGTDGIPIRDEAFRIMEKRKIEARKLVSEGLSLMREGEKKKDQTLITKGRIKKEIGEKQLKVLKAQAEEKKEEDKSYGF